MNGKTEIVQQLLAGFIRKRHIFELDVTVQGRREAFSLILVLFGIHDIGNAVNGDTRLAHLRNHAPQHADWPGHQGAVRQKGDIRPGSHLASDAENRSETHCQKDLCTGENVPCAPERRKRSGKFHPEPGIVLILCFKAIQLRPLVSERPYHAHSGQVLLGHGREDALVFVTVQKGLADPPMEIEGIDDDHRNRSKRNQR